MEDCNDEHPNSSVTGRFGPPYGAELRRLIYVVSDVVNEGNDAPRDFKPHRAGGGSSRLAAALPPIITRFGCACVQLVAIAGVRSTIINA
jgi:hypothetical protein